MTPEVEPTTRLDPSTDAVPGRLARLLALSGIAFAVLLLFGWFLSAGDTPDYMASNEDWIDWAGDNRSRSGIAAFLMLLAGFVFLYFAGTIRDVLGSAEILLSDQWTIPDFYPMDYIPNGVRLTAYHGEASELPPDVLQGYLDAVAAGDAPVPVGHVRLWRDRRRSPRYGDR